MTQTTIFMFKQGKWHEILVEMQTSHWFHGKTTRNVPKKLYNDMCNPCETDTHMKQLRNKGETIPKH